MKYHLGFLVLFIMISGFSNAGGLVMSQPPMSHEPSFSDPNRSAQENVVDVTLTTDNAWLAGPWNTSTVVSGFLGTHYLYSTAKSGVQSILTWEWQAPFEGYYDVYERHTADGNRSQRAHFTIENYSNHTHKDSYVNQQVNDNTWVKLGTVHMSSSAKITVSLSNDVVPGLNGNSITSNVVIANGVRFVHVTGERYTTSSVEMNNVNMSCPSGLTPNLVVGHYYDPNRHENRCSFDSSETSGNGFLAGNYLCGDPSWGVQKHVTVEYQCR